MRSLTDVLESLAECLCNEVLAVHPVCACGVMPGSSVPWDFCGECSAGQCGQAWVSVNSVFPTQVFPQPTLTATCAVGIAASISVGVLRCLPVMDGDGSVPHMEDMHESTVLMVRDMKAAHRAIACCFDDDTLYSIESWTPLGPEGGCVGGNWTVVVEVA